MILVTRTTAGGQPEAWVDTDTRTLHDTASGAETFRPLTARENAAADALEFLSGLRDQLAAGITAMVAARDDAQADVPVAQGLQQSALAHKTAATTQRGQVTAFTPAATYSATQLGQVRDQLALVLERQAVILQAMADMYAYRVAVDRNAVDTDNALLWLAQLVARVLNDPTP